MQICSVDLILIFISKVTTVQAVTLTNVMAHEQYQQLIVNNIGVKYMNEIYLKSQAKRFTYLQIVCCYTR